MKRKFYSGVGLLLLLFSLAACKRASGLTLTQTTLTPETNQALQQQGLHLTSSLRGYTAEDAPKPSSDTRSEMVWRVTLYQIDNGSQQKVYQTLYAHTYVSSQGGMKNPVYKVCRMETGCRPYADLDADSHQSGDYEQSLQDFLTLDAFIPYSQFSEDFPNNKIYQAKVELILPTGTLSRGTQGKFKPSATDDEILATALSDLTFPVVESSAPADAITGQVAGVPAALPPGQSWQPTTPPQPQPTIILPPTLPAYPPAPTAIPHAKYLLPPAWTTTWSYENKNYNGTSKKTVVTKCQRIDHISLNPQDSNFVVGSKSFPGCPTWVKSSDGTTYRINRLTGESVAGNGTIRQIPQGIGFTADTIAAAGFQLQVYAEQKKDFERKVEKDGTIWEIEWEKTYWYDLVTGRLVKASETGKPYFTGTYQGKHLTHYDFGHLIQGTWLLEASTLQYGHSYQ